MTEHTKCIRCGRYRQRGENGFRVGKCWDIGLCSRCASKDSKTFGLIYRQSGHNIRKGMRSGERNWGSGGFVAPRPERIIPCLKEINKATGDRLARLLERRIEEIYD